MIREEVTAMTTFARELFLFSFEDLKGHLVKVSFCFFYNKYFLLRNAAFASSYNIYGLLSPKTSNLHLPVRFSSISSTPGNIVRISFKI